MAIQIYSEPCIGCGSCCKAEICDHGILFLRTVSPPCPALEKRLGKYYCGLVVNTARYVHRYDFSDEQISEIKQSLMETFEFGVGCDSKLRCPDPNARPSRPVTDFTGLTADSDPNPF